MEKIQVEKEIQSSDSDEEPQVDEKGEKIKTRKEEQDLIVLEDTEISEFEGSEEMDNDNPLLGKLSSKEKEEYQKGKTL